MTINVRTSQSSKAVRIQVSLGILSASKFPQHLWLFLWKNKPASNFLSLISTKILNASAAVSRASCRFFLPRLSWLILSWSQKEVKKCEKNSDKISNVGKVCWNSIPFLPHADFQVLSSADSIWGIGSAKDKSIAASPRRFLLARNFSKYCPLMDKACEPLEAARKLVVSRTRSLLYVYM